MAKSVRSYQREIRRLKNLLAGIEWVQPIYNGAPSCSCCGEMKHRGHAKDCELVEIVYGPHRIVSTASTRNDR